MNSVAVSRGVRKAIRTLIQTIAGGGLTALATAVAGGLSPTTSMMMMAVFTAIVTLAQNSAETAGKIPVLLPSPGLVVSTVAPVAQATVDAEASPTGAVTGTVVDTEGAVVGEVSGQVKEPPKEPPL